MRCNKEFHTNICKYLWNAKWRSYYYDFCLRWTNKKVEGTWRTKPAFLKQLDMEELEDVQSNSENPSS